MPRPTAGRTNAHHRTFLDSQTNSSTTVDGYMQNRWNQQSSHGTNLATPDR